MLFSAVFKREVNDSRGNSNFDGGEREDRSEDGRNVTMPWKTICVPGDGMKRNSERENLAIQGYSLLPVDRPI